MHTLSMPEPGQRFARQSTRQVDVVAGPEPPSLPCSREGLIQTCACVRPCKQQVIIIAQGDRPCRVGPWSFTGSRRNLRHSKQATRRACSYCFSPAYPLARCAAHALRVGAHVRARASHAPPPHAARSPSRVAASMRAAHAEPSRVADLTRPKGRHQSAAAIAAAAVAVARLLSAMHVHTGLAPSTARSPLSTPRRPLPPPRPPPAT